MHCIEFAMAFVFSEAFGNPLAELKGDEMVAVVGDIEGERFWGKLLIETNRHCIELTNFDDPVLEAIPDEETARSQCRMLKDGEEFVPRSPVATHVRKVHGTIQKVSLIENDITSESGESSMKRTQTVILQTEHDKFAFDTSSFFDNVIDLYVNDECKYIYSKNEVVREYSDLWDGTVTVDRRAIEL